MSLFADPARERSERALESKVLEGLRPQPAGDPSDVLGSLAGGLAQLVELFAPLVWDDCRQALDLKHHAGERLADLVVQFASDPLSLSLLDHQRPARALTPLGFQPVEHVVEGLRQRGYVRLAVHACARPRRQRIVTAHRLGELVKRTKRGTEEHEA